jgi:hypothetical protein
MEITEIGALLVKAETTYGTDPTPTGGANAIPTAGDAITYDLETQYTPRRVAANLLGKIRGYNSLPNVTLKFRYELRGNRTTGTGASDISEGTVSYVVELDALLKACNLQAVYTAANPTGTRNGSVEYIHDMPANGIGASVTCYWYTGAKVHKLVGGKATAAIVIEPGKMGYIDFTVRGKYVAVANAALPGLSYQTTKPPVCEGATLQYVGSVGTWNPVVARLEMDLGNQLVMRPNALAADGVAGFIVGGRESTAKLLVESEDINAANPFADQLLTDASRSINCVMGLQTGNKITLNALGDVTKVSYQSDGPRRMYAIDMSCASTTIPNIGNEFRLMFS